MQGLNVVGQYCADQIAVCAEKIGKLNMVADEKVCLETISRMQAYQDVLEYSMAVIEQEIERKRGED